MIFKSNMQAVKRSTGMLLQHKSINTYLKVGIPLYPSAIILALGLIVTLLIDVYFEDEGMTTISMFITLATCAVGIGVGIYLKNLFSVAFEGQIDKINQAFEKCYISIESNEIRGVMTRDSKENDISQMNSIMYSILSPLKPYMAIPTTCSEVKFRLDQIPSIDINNKVYGLAQFENCFTLTYNGVNYYLMCLNWDDVQRISEAFNLKSGEGKNA